MRVAEKTEPDDVTNRELRVLSRQRPIEARLRLRARVILLAAEGGRNKDSPSIMPWTGAKRHCGGSGSCKAAPTH
jgi:hypothetical protein